MTRCAKCADPGKQTLYRRAVPPGIHESRCERHGVFWAVPLCMLHYAALSRCAEPDCGKSAHANGYCLAHNLAAHRRKLPLWRNCKRCLRCGVSVSAANYKASGLCKACYRQVDPAPYALQLRQANLKTAGSAVLALCRLVGATETARRLSVSVSVVHDWIKGDALVPGDVDATVRAMLEGES